MTSCHNFQFHCLWNKIFEQKIHADLLTSTSPQLCVHLVEWLFPICTCGLCARYLLVTGEYQALWVICGAAYRSQIPVHSSGCTYDVSVHSQGSLLCLPVHACIPAHVNSARFWFLEFFISVLLTQQQHSRRWRDETWRTTWRLRLSNAQSNEINEMQHSKSCQQQELGLHLANLGSGDSAVAPLWHLSRLLRDHVRRRGHAPTLITLSPTLRPTHSHIHTDKDAWQICFLSSDMVSRRSGGGAGVLWR